MTDRSADQIAVDIISGETSDPGVKASTEKILGLGGVLR